MPTSPAPPAEQLSANRPGPHPALQAEQTHLDLTVAAMLRQIDRWEDRDLNVGADLETSMVMADVSNEHAAALSLHVHAPYHGRLDLRVGGREQTLYIGKHAFRDLHGNGSVVSWESDVGALFYQDATTWTTPKGLQGVVRRRRQVDVKAKRVTSVTDLYDDAQGGETGGREEVLIERLSQASTAGMTQVAATLQPEQNEVLRAQAGRSMILQGAAGSGKTTVAFHRLAWLTHPERKEQQARAEHCMVLMPNAVLAHYASRVLPELGLEGVNVTTPEQWALSFLGTEKMTHVDRTLALIQGDRDPERRKAAWRRAKAMGDLRMLQVLRAHLQARLSANVGSFALKCEVSVHGRTQRLTLSSEDLHALLNRTLARDPHHGVRPALKEALEAALLGQATFQEQDESNLIRQLQPDVARTVSRIFAGLLPVSETRRLLADRSLLERAAAGVLDPRVIDLLMTDPLAGTFKPRGAWVDATELPLMLGFAGLIDGLGKRTGRVLEPFDELLCDEGQDFAPLFYALLARAARPGHITVLGDMNQGLQSFRGPSSWKEVEAALPGAQTLSLSRTYRSTRQITELTSKIAATYNRAGPVTGVDRSGSEVKRYTGGPLAVLLAQAVKDLQREGHVNIAIITRRAVDADLLAPQLAANDVDAQPILNPQARYRGGVVLMHAVLAKGLETDACIVAGADAETYDPATEYETRTLYVAASRGLHALALVAEGELHPLLR